MSNFLEHEVLRDLQHGTPYRFDEEYTSIPLSHWFCVYLDPYDDNLFIIQYSQWDAWICLPRELAENPAFDVADWYEGQLIGLLEFFVCPDLPPVNKSGHKPDDDTGGGSMSIINNCMEHPCGSSADKH